MAVILNLMPFSLPDYMSYMPEGSILNKNTYLKDLSCIKT
jgi:hypothetical protein